MTHGPEILTPFTGASTSTADKSRMLRAIESGLQFLLSRVAETGAITMEEGSEATDPGYYYKSVWALAAGGRLHEANLVASYVEKNFHLRNGDFSGGKVRSSIEWFQRRYYAYLNTWFIIGSQKIGRFDLSLRSVDYIISYFDPKTGGFCNEKPYPHGAYLEDSQSASYCGHACLHVGRLEEAKKSGAFLIRLLKSQPPRVHGFYTSINERGHLIREYEKEDEIYRFMDFDKKEQYYFMVGFPVIFLSKLYLATHDRIYLNAARAYFNITKGCRDDVYASPPSGKLGFGSTILHGITHDESVGLAARKEVEFLLEHQEKDGSWRHFPGFHLYGNGEPISDIARVDITAEFCTWLSEILQGSVIVDH